MSSAIHGSKKSNKMAAAAVSSPSSDTCHKQSSTTSKMHRRSRSGCFTCRLRRKKCDEGKPGCKACRHLGLKCEFKRPMWWGSSEQRRVQKDHIKDVIKRTKHTEKASAQSTIINTHTIPSCTTPPSLGHSTPSDHYSDGIMRTRGGSMESQYSFGDFATAMQAHDTFNTNTGMMIPPQYYNPFSLSFMPPTGAYDMDIKTERHIFVNDVQTRRDSTISTFSTFPSTVAPLSTDDQWLPGGYVAQHHHESIEFTEEPLDMNLFNLQQHTPFSPPQPQVSIYKPMVQVEECDQHLLDHFINNVARLIFPILEANRPGSSLMEVVFPAMEQNKTYLHCCLSISALHLKAVSGFSTEENDNQIIKHKFATINELCESLNRDTDHMQILEATLGMIFFQCGIGRPDDCLPDIPWHSHFQAATSLVTKLELPSQLVACSSNPLVRPSFSMSIAAWIDILGATMLGRTPSFADTYRETNVANGSAGLSEFMGCDDRIMFLISEIVCLEALKNEGMDIVQLCNHVRMLGEQLSLTETSAQGSTASSPSSNSSGNFLADLRQKNITSIFRIAARLYLCSLLPEFDISAPHIITLVTSLTNLLHTIASGPEGFDRAVAWPLLIAGAASLPGSDFRRVFADRMAIAGGQGSLGRCSELLAEHWKINDMLPPAAKCHWRTAMQGRGWDWLII